MKVTVFVMTYNHVGFIRQALDSILAQQTGFDFEVVISEDCSTDGTREIVLQYALDHPDKFHVLPSSVNFFDLRIADGFFKSARGEYTALLDGDDFWTSPYKLQRQIEFMEKHPEYSICWHYQECVDAEGKRALNQNAHSSKELWLLEDILEECPIGTSSVVLRRSMLPPLPDWLNQCPFRDFPIFVLCLQNGPGGYLDESLGAYRIHARGLYSGTDELTQKLLYQRTFRQVYRHLAPRHKEHVARLFARRWASVAMLQVLKGDRLACKEIAREGLADFPHDVRLRLLAHLPILYGPLRSVWMSCKLHFGWKFQGKA